MAEDFSRELDVALQAVAEAAKLCRSVNSRIAPDVLEKKDKSPVTIADFGSQALVARVLETHFPDDAIIGEEDAAELRQPEQAGFLKAIHDEMIRLDLNPSDEAIFNWVDRCSQKEHCDRFWTLDPIDGTKGFLRREQYAISLALIVDGVVTVAAVGCPNLGADVDTPPEGGGLVFAAVRGQGATVRSLVSLLNPEPVRVSSRTKMSEKRFCESVESGHSSHNDSAEVASRLGIKADPVRLDSQAKYCVVARGEADIYLRLPTRPGYQEKIWDHAGGVLVVEEAGGTITDVTGKPLEFTHGSTLKENRGVVVSNGSGHDEIIAALAAVGVS
ncbi:3'(2'),5'-bisphosphate nucleotidase [Rubinisphaera margarita]|uniref:3'(2'),5'-bisphosphate nucleotidase n=1 Tax=Rubinisphaera margarita TaxID=2909586 RepID=UPI001EE7EF8F|nr:3'(2'),5'-bisphosphate nucleotidase [Rubinisphaera margarita]MCG6158608.1 3'(2'),5'-bisphosphate nucleotidase [Rubinisphaera margarita]